LIANLRTILDAQGHLATLDVNDILTDNSVV